MPTFAAIVIGPRGRRFSLMEDAPDASHLHRALRARNLWPLRIESARTRGKSSGLTMPVGDFVPLLNQLELPC